MTESELKKRTKQFALRVMKLVDALPGTKAGRAVSEQLVRSGTSVGANYRAACRGRSKRDFIAKLGIVEEEADESAFWLELIIDGGLLSSARVRPLLREAEELTAIMTSSRLTATQQRVSKVKSHPANVKRQPRVLKNRKSKIKNRKSRHGASNSRVGASR